MPTKTEANLIQKLAEVSRDIGRIPKNGYNAFHKYKYVLESDLVDHIRPLLADRNIFIVPRVAEEFKGTDSGKFAHEYDGESLTTVIFEYDIIDGDSGEKITTSAIGYGSDKGDKGAYKASTGAYKYMLMRLFQVATGDDPEGDERTDQRVSQPAGGQMPQITTSDVAGIGLGGKGSNATTAQIKDLKEKSRALSLGTKGLRDLIDTVLGDALDLPEEPEAQAQVLNAYLKDLSADDLGKLIRVVNSGLPDNKPLTEGQIDEVLAGTTNDMDK